MMVSRMTWDSLTDRQQQVAIEALFECASVLRRRDMFYSGELCAELQCVFEEISRSGRWPSAGVHGRVSFSQDGIAGFSRVIVLDASHAVTPTGFFDFDIFVEVIAKAIAEALGLDLDTRNLHREQLSQFLKDERGILFCFFSLDNLTQGHYRQLRGLGFTQTDHRILFCGQSEFLQEQSTSFAESPGSGPFFGAACIIQSDSESGSDQFQSAHVRILTGGMAMAVYPVESGGLSIGRWNCGLVINDDIWISRKHARIERNIAGWHLQDLSSRNGFFVNGRRFGSGERVTLFDSAVIRLSDSLLVFHVQPPPADDRIESSVFPGVSPAAAAVRRRIDALAASTGHVLILGETGTGKERVARAIGEARTPPPMVTVNCAQLSRVLASIELFGHARGAFTGAVGNKPGLVDLAGDGALFLDEIGELPFEVQADLLRFLEDGSYRAVGSTVLRHSLARVIAATSVDLDEAVHQGRFRRDLLARLRAANAPLELPPLRDRREDILGWSQLFFREIGRDAGAPPWSTSALECLLLYPWPENLRELLGAVRHAATEATELPCERSHLPAKLRAHRSTLRGTGDDQTPAVEPRDPLPRQSDPGREEIEDALRRTEGRMRSAAQHLGVDRRKLYRLCEGLGIAFEAFRPDTNREDG